MVSMRDKKKFEIFIGSTKKDLSKAREAIIQGILEVGHIPSGMELWAAGTNPTKADITNRLSTCDIHIILLGARYGHVPVDSKISITEWEYDQSENADNRYVIAFFLDDESFEIERKKIHESKSINIEDTKEKEHDDILRKLRKKILCSRICREFSNTPDGINKLKFDCINSINEVIDTCFTDGDGGWTRTNSKYAETLNAIQNNWFLNRILNRLKEYNWLKEGVTVEKEQKNILGAVFWRHMEGRLKRYSYNDMFFESGSTLAFITRQFEEVVLKHPDDLKWKVSTNNVVILQELLLNEEIEVKPLPSGTPRSEFGGMYTHKILKNPEPAPTKPRSIYETETDAIYDLVNSFNNNSNRCLYLISASCWEICCENEYFHGLHAELHADMLFKRAIFITGQPVVCFLTSNKVGDLYKRNKHFPIFGPDYELRKILQEIPFALCLSYKKESKDMCTCDEEHEVMDSNMKHIDKLIEFLEKIDFNKDYVCQHTDGIEVRIIANKKFEEIFPGE
jgi:hypothetical protein